MLDDIEFDDGFAMVTGEASPMPRSRTPKEPDKGRVRRQTVRRRYRNARRAALGQAPAMTDAPRCRNAGR